MARKSKSDRFPAYPIRFVPVYKHYPWGGMRILRYFRRRGRKGVYAESWEISDHPDGITRVANGPLRGYGLDELIRRYAEEILGPQLAVRHFPILLKLIDARETLSVQVHPDEKVARRLGGEPKSEMWYVLEAPTGAGVYAGWEPGATKARVLQALRANKIAQWLRFVPVLPGDAIYVPGGRVHAIGAGCLLVEVQRRSNTTYRLYDWNRRYQGRRRPLHLAQALEAVHWNDNEPVKLVPKLIAEKDGEFRREVVGTCRYFRLERLLLHSGTRFAQDELSTCEIILVVRGLGQVRCGNRAENIRAGTTVLVPFAAHRYQLTPSAGTLEALLIRPL